MSNLKPASVEPIEVGHPLLVAFRKAVAESYHGLEDASVEAYWRLGDDKESWGSCRPATEIQHLMSGADVILLANKRLVEDWIADEDFDGSAAVEGYGAFLASTVEAKTGGQTKQQVAGTEDRTLFRANRPSLGISGEVLVRHPILTRALPGLKELVQAVQEPEQFMLDLQAKESDETDDPELRRARERDDGSVTTISAAAA